MEKKLFRIWIIFFFVSLILHVVSLEFLFCNANWHEHNLLEKSIMAVISSFMVSSCPMLAYYSVIPRSKYLESNDITKPPYKDACSSVLTMPQGFEFSCLKIEIANKWVITFSDDTEKVLKLRKKFHAFSSWGAAAWMKYDAETHKLYLECFSMMMMAGMRNNLAQKMLKEIELYLKSFDEDNKHNFS
jgi:hypothetical protein